MALRSKTEERFRREDGTMVVRYAFDEGHEQYVYPVVYDGVTEAMDWEYTQRLVNEINDEKHLPFVPGLHRRSPAQQAKWYHKQYEDGFYLGKAMIMRGHTKKKVIGMEYPTDKKGNRTSWSKVPVYSMSVREMTQKAERFVAAFNRLSKVLVAQVCGPLNVTEYPEAPAKNCYEVAVHFTTKYRLGHLQPRPSFKLSLLEGCDWMDNFYGRREVSA